MSTPPSTVEIGSDLSLVKLAREIAIEHHDIETILGRYQIDHETWSKIKENPRFTQLLDAEIAAWQSATNTKERTQLKASALVEEALPECNARLHDPKEALNHKVELLKVLTKVAGMDRVEREQNSGDGFHITINMGEDTKLEFNKTNPTPEAIDVTPSEQ